MAVTTTSGKSVNLGGVSTQSLFKSAASVKIPGSLSVIVDVESAIPVDLGTSGTTISIDNSSLQIVPTQITPGITTPSPPPSPRVIRGISNKRPEIIGVFDAISIGSDNPTPEQVVADEFVSIQHAAKALAHDNIIGLLDFLKKDPNSTATILEIQNELIKIITDAKLQTQFVASARNVMNAAGNSLDMIVSADAINTELKINAQDSNNEFITVDSIFAALGYSKEQLNKFSGTKAFSILLGDIRRLILNDRQLDSSARTSDASAVKLVFNTTSGVLLGDLASKKPISKLKDLTELISTFSSDKNERLNSAINALGRELRISSALAIPEIEALIRSILVNYPTGHELINALIMSNHDNVINIPTPSTALIDTAYIAVDRLTTILPFENRNITFKNKNFISGKNALVESIVTTADFDTSKFLDFSTNFTSKVTQTSEIIRKLLLVDYNSKLESGDIFDDAVSILSQISSGISSTAFTGVSSALAIALLNESNDDIKIRSMITKLIYLLVIEQIESSLYITSAIKDEAFIEENLQITQKLADIHADMGLLLEQSTVTRKITGTIGNKKVAPTKVTDRNALQNMIVAAIENAIVDKYTSSAGLMIRNKNIFSVKTSSQIAVVGETAISTMLLENGGIFSKIIDAIVVFVKRAIEVAGGRDFTAAGLTKFSGIDLSHITFLFTEIMIAMSASFLTCSFTKSALGTTGINIEFDPAKNSLFTSMVTGKFGTTTITFGSLGVTHSVIPKDLQQLRMAIIERENVLMAILECLDAHSKVITSQAGILASFFDMTTGTANESSLSRIISVYRPSEFHSLFSTPQISLSLAQLNSMPINPDEIMSNPTFDNFMIDASILDIIHVICKDANIFPNDSSTRLFAIGVPLGMTDEIAGPFDVKTGTNIHLPKESDVIKINFYRKNNEFEDLIYKPRQFIFDVSKFVDMTSFAGNETQVKNIDDIVIAANFIDTSGGAITNHTTDDMFRNQDYSFLDENMIDSMIKNHVISQIMWCYIRLICGFDISEAPFLASPRTVTTDNATLIIATVKILQSLLGFSKSATSPITLDQLRAANSEIDAFVIRLQEFATKYGITLDTSSPMPAENVNISDGLTSNLLTFSKVFGGASFISCFGDLSYRLTTPKAFERIFIVPVDLDSFEIDVTETSKTEAGRAVLNSRIFNTTKSTSSTTDTVKIPTLTRIDDIFVTVEPAYEV